LAEVKLDPAEMVPLIAPLLDMPLPAERAPKLSGEELRRRQLAALTNWVIAGAKVQPVVLAFEDLHWADPTTLDVLRGIAERGALAPLLIVATTRPEFRPPWSMRSHHGTISLAPLDRAQVRDMVGELSARHALPRDVVEDVAARTGGVPLFVEEVTRLLLERGEGGGGIEAIPPTLQQSLMARLDRLGSAREVAQIGSVIGRGFSYGLLRDVAGMEDAPLQAALEKLADADIVLVQGLPPESDYRFKHALIQDAAYENLLKSRRQVLHRRVAETLRDRFADTAAVEPEVLAHHFTQAGLTDAAIEWWGKAGDQALRRSAFQEAIAHLGKAIEMADKLAQAAPAEAPQGVGRVRLQTAYGNALIAARGHGAPETTAAFTRATELAAGTQDTAEQFSARYGLWTSSYVRGERTTRELAMAFLRDAECVPNSPEVLVGHRIVGISLRSEGDYIGARGHLEQALSSYDAELHGPLAFRYGVDSRVSCMVYLALTLWPLGDVTRALLLADEAVALAQKTGHVATLAYALGHVCSLDLLRRDARRLLTHAKSLVDLSREHGLRMWFAVGTFELGHARWRTGERQAGKTEMLAGIGRCREQELALELQLLEAAYAEAQSEMGPVESAVAILDGAFALSERTGQRWHDAELNRLRGNILLKRDPANTAPAEDAFLTAIAVAREQKARSFELRAALSLAKLYQSTGRPADAHAVLAPALEGFTPTPKFPEIEEAQTLLAALAETDEVKNAAVSRQRRLKLQTSYGQAMLHARGYSAPETTAAFARAHELTAGIENPAERFSVYFGLWAGSFVRGDLAATREITDIMLTETKERPDSPEACTAIRLDGNAHWMAGNFVMARDQLERALAMFDPERDADLVVRFAQDVGVAIMAYLALALWPLGEVDRARKIAEEMMARATQIGHVGSIVYGHSHVAALELMRLNLVAAGRNSETQVELARAHEIPMFAAYGAFYRSWSRVPLVDREIGLADMRAAIAACRKLGIGLNVPRFVAALAEAEAQAGDFDAALATVEGAIAEIERDGQRWCEAEAHRIRGEILLKRDPAKTAPAEEAFLAAIAIAQQQQAKSFELRAALSLAKLYQSTNRAADAHAALAPALESFSLTPEFPEIAEAQTLLAALAETDEVKSAAAARQRRLHLQTSYGQALLWSKGYADKEAKAAFARAAELASGIEDTAERLKIYYGQCLGNLLRGEYASAQSLAEGLLRFAERRGRAQEAAFARRVLGLTHHMQGAFAEAQTLLEQALNSSDGEGEFRAGPDMIVAAKAYLSHTAWVRGEFVRARSLINESVARAVSASDIPDQCTAYSYESVFAILRNDAEAARGAAERLIAVAQEHGVKLFLLVARVYADWARARLDRSSANRRGFQQSLAAYTEEGNKYYVPLFLGLLAAVEVETQSEKESALARIDEALALAQQTGEHWTDAFLHRIRGEILLKLDTANTARAEDAFLTAIAVAQQQKARSFELRAALSVAKLYESTNRAADAHAVLMPALQGFAPTLEFPEIEQAQRLLGTLQDAAE
jgi:predicted ATPase